MQRLALLFLPALLAAACGNSGNGYATVPPPDTGLVWPISVQCLRKLPNGVDDTVTTTTRDASGKVNWVPGCTEGQQTGTWRCPAPPTVWWGGASGAQGNIRCYLSPCNGVDPGKVSWLTFPNGPVVAPKQVPPSLPKVVQPGGSDPTPAGGGDDCLFDTNSWVFAQPQ